MTKRLISAIITMVMVLSLIPTLPTQAVATISIGQYVQMGSYYGEPILWRCVDIDENGPLMLADKILTIKPFDAAGTHPNDYSNYRLNYGSNLWETSNMRSWLNSTAGVGNVVWLCGNPPTYANVGYGYNDYATEKGFMADGNFTQGERNAIKTVSQKSLLNYQDRAMATSGTASIHIVVIFQQYYKIMIVPIRIM